MGGFARCRKAFGECVAQSAPEVFDNRRLEFSEVFFDRFFGLHGPQRTAATSTLDGKNVYRLSKGLYWIEDIWKRLRDIEVYIGRFPYSDTGISRIRHLAYHFENHLQLVYVLRERLKEYWNMTKQVFKDDPQYERCKLTVSKSITSNFKQLDKFKKDRGIIVHNIDIIANPDIDRLEFQELTSELMDEMPSLWWLRRVHDSTYRKIRNQFRKAVAADNIRLASVLDSYFDALLQVIADESGRLRLP